MALSLRAPHRLYARRLPNLRDTPRAPAAAAAAQGQDDDDQGAHPEGHDQHRQRWVQLPPRSDAGGLDRTKAGNVSVMESSVSLPNLSFSLGGASGGGGRTLSSTHDEGRAEKRHNRQRLAAGEVGECRRACKAGHHDNEDTSFVWCVLVS